MSSEEFHQTAGRTSGGGRGSRGGRPRSNRNRRRGRGGRGRGHHAEQQAADNSSEDATSEQIIENQAGCVVDDVHAATDGRGTTEEDLTGMTTAAAAGTAQHDSHHKRSSHRFAVWLESSLITLGYHSNNLVDGENNNNKKTEKDVFDFRKDRVFQNMVQFLEDRCIRLWDFNRRNSVLRDTDTDAFWTKLPEYLEALDCPKVYYYCNVGPKVDADNKTSEKAWYENTTKRSKVLHWLISCAIQEVHEDQISIMKPRQNNNKKNGPTAEASTESPSSAARKPPPETQVVTPAAVKDVPTQQSPAAAAAAGGETKAASVTSQSNLQLATSSRLLSPSSYPLGFSTGDDEVDQVLTLLRMQLLVEMEEEQKKINTEIANFFMTNQTNNDNNETETAKKLKPYKPRRGKK